MDIIVNNIESSSNVRMTRSSVEKKKSTERPIVISKKSKQEGDQVILSKFNKTQKEAIDENQTHDEKSKEEKKLSQKEIQEFHNKMKGNQYVMEEVDDKIVYSLMTLPAFQHMKLTKNQSESENEIQKISVKNELDELKKIQEELNSGEKMEKVLEEALDYLMRSLVS